ncbi:MAG: ribosome recycling factor [Oscillospiraceae bacterium]|nr:ribosome recycling factor [Oscillospiraceae bacterium]MBQ8917697.1 ribosome recycling factor [Oscillospiraceae bacterium]
MKQHLVEFDTKMTKTMNNMRGEFSSIRAGRANPAVLDKIRVDYYGTPTPINQMAAVSVSEARILVIQPWDKSTMKPIEKAIQSSDIGINPTNDGVVLRIAFPPLTEERRKELCKSVRKLAEDAKVAIRSIRRDANDKFKTMKKNSEITEDDQKNYENDIQKLTDQYCKDIDTEAAAKEKEILEL